MTTQPPAYYGKPRPDCAYCGEIADFHCSTCDRPICREHSHSAEGERWCEPTGGEAIAFYTKHGRPPECGEALR